MAYEFRFPDVGEGITEGEVVRWHVEEGQPVGEDQVLLEVETDKAVVEIPSPVGGVVLRRLVDEGDVIHVGDVMVIIEEACKGTGHPGTKERKAPEAEPGAPSPSRREKDGISGGKAPGKNDRLPVAAAPATRRLAREMGVALDGIDGSGPGGRVTAEDVRRAASGPPAGRSVKAPAEEAPRGGRGGEERVAMRGVRKRVSEAMLTSVRKIPHVTHVEEVDVTRLIALRRALLDQWGEQGPKISYLPFVIKAAAGNLPDHPALNASVDEERDEIVYRYFYHIGMATATPDGLIVPVIRDADRLGILELTREIERLAEATRSRKIPLEDLKGATFSITNFGTIGGLFGTPIIHHPETAILGVGRFFRRVVLVEGRAVERDYVYLSLSFDHRVADGADAALFVNGVKRFLEEPETHFMELI